MPLKELCQNLGEDPQFTRVFDPDSCSHVSDRSVSSCFGTEKREFPNASSASSYLQNASRFYRYLIDTIHQTYMRVLEKTPIRTTGLASPVPYTLMYTLSSSVQRVQPLHRVQRGSQRAWERPGTRQIRGVSAEWCTWSLQPCTIISGDGVPI